MTSNDLPDTCDHCQDELTYGGHECLGEWICNDCLEAIRSDMEEWCGDDSE